MLINTEKKKKEIEEFINDKILHKQPIFVYFRYIPSNRTLIIKKENILNIDAIHILDSLDKRTTDEALESFNLDKKYANRSFINDNFYMNVLFDSEIEAYKNELYNEIVSIENKLNFLNY